MGMGAIRADIAAQHHSLRAGWLEAHAAAQCCVASVAAVRNTVTATSGWAPGTLLLEMWYLCLVMPLLVPVLLLLCNSRCNDELH